MVLLLLLVIACGWQRAEARNQMDLSLLAAIVDMDKHEGFFQCEALPHYEVPLQREWTSGWTVRSMLNSVFGTISAAGQTLFVSSIGTSFSLGK